MSGNQSRFDKSDFRKPGRSGNSSGTYQRSFSNKNSGGSAAGSGPPPSVSYNRSFKKTNNVQGGQPVGNPQPTVAPPSQTQHNFQNYGVPEQKHIRVPAGTAVSEVAARAYDTSSSQRSNPVVPKGPSQSAAMSSDAMSPMTPVKEVAPKPVAVQFGSISPGFVNGMQIPTRTSPAPPNMDEQKRNQARIDSFRAVPTAPVPAVPKPQLPEKEGAVTKHVQGMEPHSVSRLKKEHQVSSAPSSSLPQKPSIIPMSGIPMQAPFHQQQVHLPFGGINPPIQPQGVPGASIHMPLHMHYHMGNAPRLQHQMFMPNIQPHPMQHQSMMHQGQGMSFPAQLGPHISHQLYQGMSTPPQYALQQAGKFAPPRKAVVITHPDTREELKLDRRGDKHGAQQVDAKQSLPIQVLDLNRLKSASSKGKKKKKELLQKKKKELLQKADAASGPSPNFYPNSFNSSPYFVPATSLSVTNVQGTSSSHATKFNPVSQGPPASGYGMPSFGGKVVISVPAPNELVKTERSHATQVAGSAVPASKKVNSGYNNVSGQHPATVAVKIESPKLGAQVDAKQCLPIGNSGKASTNVIESSKCASSKGKRKKKELLQKKKKELLQKADAAGTKFDLHTAYKSPEEQKETNLTPDSEETGTILNETKMMASEAVPDDSDTMRGGSQSKGVPDDWEDEADVATPKTGAPDNDEQHLVYSRDFLLKFQSQIYDLPKGFSVAPSVANALLIPNANKGHLDRDSYPSPGRHTGGGSCLDCHGPAMDDDDDKWSTQAQLHFVHNRDHVNNAGGYKPAQGGNFGVLRNPRQTAGHAPEVVNRSGPSQSINAMHRNNTEDDRWLRGSNFQKGLLPSPQIPSQLMHKAEMKYEVGKVADEEQAKQRRLKDILNKLTPQNFVKVFEQVKAVNIDSAVTLNGVISQIFDKALTEPTFCEMYADFCYHLSGELPDFSEENEKITFKRVLLNKCQEEFERGEREQEEANRSEDSEIAQTKEEREERRVQVRRRMLGNIRLIWELFKRNMLTERIMHECIKKLLGQQQNPDEEDIEALQIDEHNWRDD